MERLRRTMMFVPASNAGMLKDAGLYGADTIMFDLEDSVALTEKDTARFLLYQALKTFDYGESEVLVRINALSDGGIDDIRAMVRAGVDGIRSPKTETAQDIHDIEEVIYETEKAIGKEIGSTKIFAAIEGPSGVLNAREIANASSRMIGIAIGGEDYTTAMGTHRYFDRNGEELYFARSMIVHAAREAGISAVDTVFADINDMKNLQRETELIKQLGFDGKSVINPRQIPYVNEVFKPTQEELDHAQRVLIAVKEAEKQGRGVLVVDGKMVDGPIIEDARVIVKLAKATGVRKGTV